MRARLVTLAAVLLAVVACDAGPEETAPDPEPEDDPAAEAPEAPEDAPPDDGAADVPPELADFCRIQVEMDRQADQRWVGSDEHVAALDDLAEAAPEDLREDVERIRDHIDDEVSPDDPDSQSIGSYPGEVREAIERVDALSARECGFEPPADA